MRNSCAIRNVKDQGPVSRKSRNFSGDKNLFVSSTGTRFVLWNFAVILSFLLSATYWKSGFSRQAVHSFRNYFSGPISYRVFRETAPRPVVSLGPTVCVNLGMRNVTWLCHAPLVQVLVNSFCFALFSLILLLFSQMAKKSDEDVKRKGQDLWRALKKDPLDRKRIQELLKNGAPTNFREPRTEVKYVNLLLFNCFETNRTHLCVQQIQISVIQV